MKEKTEMEVLLEAGAIIATDEDMHTRGTDRKIEPLYQGTGGHNYSEEYTTPANEWREEEEEKLVHKMGMDIEFILGRPDLYTDARNTVRNVIRTALDQAIDIVKTK